MNVTDKLYTEWAWRTKTGVPDINNPEDKAILENLFGELGIKEEEEQASDRKVTQVSNEDLSVLKNAFESIKEPYSRYLSIFNYFDPNSLGTISEVLLTKLLNSIDGIQADHVGGGQGLADLIVNGHPISLKTTAADKAIGLGSDELVTNPADSKEVVDALKIIFEKNPDLSNLPFKDLQGKIPARVYTLITNKLTSVAKKLTGENNKELFVWVEKVYTGKVLSSIIIHTLKYDFQEIMDEFLNSIIFISKEGTGKAYGLKDPEGITTIVPDTGSKLLNVHPKFVRKSTKDNVTRVNLVTDIKMKPEDIKEKLPERFFQSLDQIYSDIFGG